MNIQTQLTPRAQQMFALIEKYLASGLSQKAFCAQEQLAFATFQCWLRKYRAQQQSAPREPGNGFIPLHLREAPRTMMSPLTYVVEFPNGVIVRLSGQVDLQLLSHLVAAR